MALVLIAVLGAMPYVGMAGQADVDAQGVDAREMPCHDNAPKPDPGAKDDCGSCPGSNHCCTASLPPAFASAPHVFVGAFRISGGQSIAAGVVFAPLDPPPLAL